ncbi:hypothetical protein GCM10007216_17900 [Thalassobacillus devorans]|uniref:DUF1798 family protein n=1 Tax=Thalassobacillus devorans TaxID=279813 RepID=A0ABQ1NZ58_9BACI|nr:DUF1798 family protein [Thalassobacillus devorans]NIK28266.1 hypothetical protein [Thalassobacillus devorans]GGC87591.1 hypothetical protein GCM10007216_17900 [Thalassobacillus devorans]
MKDLVELTEKVKDMIDELSMQYERITEPIDKNDHDFFQKVKTETEPMFQLNDKWREAAENFVKNKQVNVHPNQVKSTHENVELLILHSYYIDVKKKRYNELNHSVHYVMDMLLKDWNEGKGDQ